MAKRPRTFTAAFVRTISRPGVYGDGRGGRGLSLRIHRTATGRISKTWRQRVRIEGRLTSIGLGPYPEITLAEARQKALDNSRAVLQGSDPRGRGVPTFAEAAARTIELHRDGWKAGSPLPEQWESTFRLHAAPLLDKPVDRITSADVLGCLAPIWNSKPGAARKARHRFAAVFRWCIGRNHRPDNPVDRAVVALPRTNGTAPRHYRALPHRDVAAAVGAIRRVKYIHPSAVLCVEMIALTAVRAGEARGARWEEIDLEAARWTIPASRMKAGREFSVPLSTGALGVLGRARTLSPESSLVFPSKTGGVLPRNAPGPRASTSWGRLDGSRVPFERTVVDGRIRGPGGGRGGLPCPCAPESSRSGRISGPTCWSAARRSSKRGATTSRSDRPPFVTRRGPSGPAGLRARFGSFHVHFGEATGRGIASDRRSRVSEGYGVGAERGPRGRRAPGRPRRPSGQRPRGRGACRRWPRHRSLGARERLFGRPPGLAHDR